MYVAVLGVVVKVGHVKNVLYETGQIGGQFRREGLASARYRSTGSSGSTSLVVNSGAGPAKEDTQKLRIHAWQWLQLQEVPGPKMLTEEPCRTIDVELHGNGADGALVGHLVLVGGTIVNSVPQGGPSFLLGYERVGLAYIIQKATF